MRHRVVDKVTRSRVTLKVHKLNKYPESSTKETNLRWADVLVLSAWNVIWQIVAAFALHLHEFLIKLLTFAHGD